MGRSDPAAPAPTFRLWLMMVLQFAIWGAWLPLIWGYMGKGGLAVFKAVSLLSKPFLLVLFAVSSSTR